MSQLGEGTATQNIYIEKPEDKDEISVRLSLFYDGTLNNRVNIGEREKAILFNEPDSPYYEYRTDDGNNSYDNGRTNIAIMEPHLLDTSDGYDIAVKAYIEGQGTFDLEGDDTKGYAFGIGASGVAGRAEQGINRGVDKIVEPIDPDDFCIKKLTIDVFGFSRGSATARYAIHLLLKGCTKWDSEYSDGYEKIVSPILELIADRRIEIYENAAEICFAGLYDTVLSTYALQRFHFKWYGNILEQKAVRFAKKALHLVAADEHRADFPLHNIKSAGNKGEEYYLPGVHSDVGGSYNAASELAIEREKNPEKKVYMKTTSENKILLKSKSVKTIETDMANLIKQGWYSNSKDKKEIKVKERKIRKYRFGGKVPYYDINYELHASRDNICTAYCNIPLKIMAKYARDKDVKLKLNNKLDDRALVILNPHNELVELEKKIHAYMAAKKGNGISKATDWTDEQAALNQFLVKNKIRHNHFHFSAHPGPGYSPNIKNGRRVRYVYKA